jgi:hypothetical protein
VMVIRRSAARQGAYHEAHVALPVLPSIMQKSQALLLQSLFLVHSRSSQGICTHSSVRP